MMVGSILVNYCLGLAIEGARRHRRDSLVICAGIIFNLLPLIGFKYAKFLVGGISDVVDTGTFLGKLDDLPLPLGISFYTFHAISYLVDVYRRDVRAERRFLDLAVYISMFPQLVSGPIIRFKTIADDLHHPVVDAHHTARGIRLFLIGLGQKVLIANTLAGPADVVFALGPDRLSATDAWLGILDYTLQIYYDFNGYSTMAIGLGLIIGFRFPPNFNYPYAALSMTDFWRRWHMSLSQWFRDYVYIPLGGSRITPARTYLNLVIVFFLCGFWHGAAWTFIAWGLYHGLFLAVERAGMGQLLERLPRILRRAYLLLAVMVGWVLFRADSFAHATVFLKAMVKLGAPSAMGVPASRLLHNDVLLALAVGVMAAGPALSQFAVRIEDGLAVGTHRFAGTAGLILVLLLASMSLAGGAYNPFIYFRF